MNIRNEERKIELLNKSKALKAKFELEKQQLELSQRIRMSMALSIADANPQ